MAGGNYGGNSIPTKAIAGDDITKAAFDHYTCTKAFATAAGAFDYDGVTFNLTAGQSIELVMDANGIGGTTANIIFLCYDCSCDAPMTGTTVGGPMYSAGTIFRPTIIGGDGYKN